MKSINDIVKLKSRGRPRTDSTPILVRLQPSHLEALDAWIAARAPPRPTRPEAIRRLLTSALATASAGDDPELLANDM